jgi:hypothetical protein
VTQATVLVTPTRVSRVLIDLAEGRLDDSELDAVTAWLSASAPADLPERLVELGLNARTGVYAPA